MTKVSGWSTKSWLEAVSPARSPTRPSGRLPTRLPTRSPTRPFSHSLVLTLPHPLSCCALVRSRLPDCVQNIRPLACTCFHESCSVLFTWPLAVSGFPYTHNKVSSKRLVSICMKMLLVCLLYCRASWLYTIWPPAWTGFHVSYRVFITGPPALLGFPYRNSKASGTDQLPCVHRSWSWASRIVGLPGHTLYGLRHGPPSGLPLCRASLIHIIRPPA